MQVASAGDKLLSLQRQCADLQAAWESAESEVRTSAPSKLESRAGCREQVQNWIDLCTQAFIHSHI